MSAQEFPEGDLLFKFGSGWHVIKWDDRKEYRDGIGKLPESKAVDFLGVHGGRLYLIEVKDGRKEEPQFLRRLKDELFVEVGQKVRDSLAGLVGRIQLSPHDERWAEFRKALLNPPARVVLWLELHQGPRGQRAEEALKAEMETRQQVLQKRIGWLTKKAFVASIRIGGHRELPDVDVRNLPGAGQTAPELPGLEEWQAALDNAQQLFELALPDRSLHARNLTEFGLRLSAEVACFEAARHLPEVLRARLRDWVRDDPQPPRLATARSAEALLKGIAAHRAIDQVRVLAEFNPRTSATALKKSLDDAQAVLRVLTDDAQWIHFRSVHKLLSDDTRRRRARALLDELGRGLSADQHDTSLQQHLQRLIEKAAALLNPPVVPPPS